MVGLFYLGMVPKPPSPQKKQLHLRQNFWI